jgi:hypothetical protein
VAVSLNVVAELDDVFGHGNSYLVMYCPATSTIWRLTSSKNSSVIIW